MPREMTRACPGNLLADLSPLARLRGMGTTSTADVTHPSEGGKADCV
jgi:hypothetical protein